MANTIKIKNSGTAANVPASLEYGELGLNYADGKLFYKNSSNAIVQLTSAGVVAGGTAGQVLSKVDGTDYNTQWTDVVASSTEVIKVTVKAGEGITKGQAVYISSANGTNIIVSKASNTGEGTSSKTLGLMGTTVSTNGFGEVITQGLLSGINTGSATAGDAVWLGTSGNLIFGLGSKPVAPAHLVYIGVVTKANVSTGEIFVRPQNGFELDELHDVSITTPASGQVLEYNGSSWVNKNTVRDNMVRFYMEVL